MPEAKTAILTGGSGFLGSHFIKGLSKNHHSIYVLDTKPLDKKLIAEFSNLISNILMSMYLKKMKL